MLKSICQATILVFLISTLVADSKSEGTFSSVSANIATIAQEGNNANGNAKILSTNNSNSTYFGSSVHIDKSVPNKNTLRDENLSSIVNLVEVWEHEFYDIDRKAWIGGSGQNMTQRWTSSPANNDNQWKILPPPPQLLPPKGYNYTSEWKIDITGSTCIRDELGWEYFIDKSDRRRRRRWLRSVALNTYSEETSTKTIHSNSKKPLSIRSPLFYKSLFSSKEAKIRNYINKKMIKAIRDSFNFKGYGLSCQKSMFDRQSCGIILRLPLTIHFDFFETRPWLPLLTSTCALHFPFKGTFSINASLPVALLKYMFLTLWDQIKFGFTLVWYVITKTIIIDIIGVLLLSNLGKMLGFGKKDTELSNKIKYNHKGEIIENKAKILPAIKLFQNYPALPLKRNLRYSSSISERVGVSLTWQCSTEKGVQLKCSWWHSILPTIEHIGDVSKSAIKPFIEMNSQMNSNAQLIMINEWLRRKVGSFGLTWGRFTEQQQSFYSCNAMLSLSGFYYGTESMKKIYSAPKRLFVTESKKIKTPTIKKSQTRRESNLHHIMKETEDSQCEIIDVKISAS